MNIVFDQLTPRRAETRTYLILFWQRPGDRIPTIAAAGTYRDVIVKWPGKAAGAFPGRMRAHRRALPGRRKRSLGEVSLLLRDPHP